MNIFQRYSIEYFGIIVSIMQLIFQYLKKIKVIFMQMTKLIYDIATAFDIIQLLKFKITVKTFSILVLHQLFFSPQNKDLDVIP